MSTTAYNAANELTQWGTANLFGVYPERSRRDANGNMTSDGTNSLTWDARNHLTSVNAGIDTFQYDPFGRRVAKTISGATTNFLYDGLNPVQELSGTTPTANLLTGGLDEFFTRTDSAGTRNFLTDPLGSTIALADSTGAIQTQYSYEPFGNTTVSGTASGNPYQYTGRENDSTGLYFYRARYFSPMFGRFTSQDPVGFADGVNLYAYVGNGPTRFVDPLGLDRKDPFLEHLEDSRSRNRDQRPPCSEAFWQGFNKFADLLPAFPAGTGPEDVAAAASQGWAFRYAAKRALVIPLRSSTFRAISFLGGLAEIAPLAEAGASVASGDYQLFTSKFLDRSCRP